MKRLMSRFGRVRRTAARRWAILRGAGLRSVQALDDRHFLGLFDDAAAGLSPADRSTSENIDRLLRHYAERVAAEWPALPDKITDLRLDLSAMNEREIVARADAALDHDLHPSGIPPILRADGAIDWSANPAGSREWLLMLHRHAWWPLWARAHQITGDEKYVSAFDSQITDWIRSNPMPALKSEHHAPWRLMECGLRLRLSWIPTFGYFYPSAAFSDASKLLMLRSIYDHCNFLRHYFTNRNHLVRESNGLLAAAGVFREFREAFGWRVEAISRLDGEVSDQVNEDGSHIEMSVGYQWLAIDEFEVTRNLLERHGESLPNVDLEQTLERMYQYLAVLIRPDRQFPQLNDGFILWDADRLADAGRRFGRPDIVHAATAGGDGAAPEWSSRSFPNAGLHVMRSGWTSDASYLVFDTGPYGGPHGHEDKLSFELYARGAPFVVDPGSYTYQRDDPYRNYFVGSYAHNTILVDGKSQVRRWRTEHMNPTADATIHGDWRSGEELDRARGCYDEGYADFALTATSDGHLVSDVTHVREVVFVRPDYWVIADLLESTDEHEYSTLFHLAPDIVADLRSDTVAECSSEATGAKLMLCAAATVELQSAVVIGRETPPQGWYSPDHHQKQPAPVLVFSMRGRERVLAAWVLVPYVDGRSRQKPAIEVQSAPEEGALLRLSVSMPGRARARYDEISIAVGHSGVPEVRVARVRGSAPAGGR